MDKPVDLMIVGTDTDVGKSVVSLLVMRLFFEKGLGPYYVKPFQTGCRDAYDAASDAAFVYRHIPNLQQQDPAQSVIYCHPNAKSPYHAARDAGEQIDLDAVDDRIARYRQQFSPLVIEAAGGLMVPVTEHDMVADLIHRFKCRTLLVARAGLGTINHTLLSIDALRQRGVAPMGVVLTEGAGPATDDQLLLDNIAAIESFGRVAVGGVIPRIVDFASPVRSAYAPLEKILFTSAASGGNGEG